MRFIDTTWVRIAQVASGWIAGIGAAATLLTFMAIIENGSVVSTVVLVVTVVAIAALAACTAWLRNVAPANVSFLAHHSSAGLFRHRRGVEKRANRIALVAFLTCLGLGLAFFVAFELAACRDDVECGAVAPVPLWALDALEFLSLGVGAIAAIASSFARIYSGETDDLELKALHNERSRDDGTPGLPSSRWE